MANKLKIIYRGQEISGILTRFDSATDTFHYYFAGDMHIEIPKSKTGKIELLVKTYGTSKINACRFPVIDYDKGIVSLNNIPSEAESSRKKSEEKFQKTITPIVK